MGIFRTYYSHSVSRGLARSRGQHRDAALLAKNKDRRILVILHLFYPESWKEIRQYLLNFEGYKWDLCVTFPDFLEEKLEKAGILSDIRALNPQSSFFPMENKGFDIGPFLMALRRIDLSAYDAVFKLQSKGVHRVFIYIYRQLFMGRDWFLNLYEGTVGAGVIHRTIDRIINDPQVGMMGAKNLIVHDPPYKENLVISRLSEAGLHVEKGYYFLAGTCFAVKPACLKALQSLPFTPDDFVPVPSSQGVSLAHALERYLCAVVTQSGLRIEGNEVETVRRSLKRPIENTFKKISSERLLDLPCQIDDGYFLWRLDNRFVRYRFRTMKVGDLKYQMGPGEKILPLKEAYPYRYLNGDEEAYREYCRIHEERGYPAMTPERFQELIKSMEEQGYDSSHIILVNELGILRDGQHRACCLAHKYGLDHEIEVLEVENIDRIFLAKHMVPRAVLNLYYKKRYGLEV